MSVTWSSRVVFLARVVVTNRYDQRSAYCPVSWPRAEDPWCLAFGDSVGPAALTAASPGPPRSSSSPSAPARRATLVQPEITFRIPEALLYPHPLPINAFDLRRLQVHVRRPIPRLVGRLLRKLAKCLPINCATGCLLNIGTSPYWRSETKTPYIKRCPKVRLTRWNVFIYKALQKWVQVRAKPEAYVEQGPAGTGPCLSVVRVRSGAAPARVAHGNQPDQSQAKQAHGGRFRG